jgi:predicted nucleotidyltransferase
MNQLRGDVPKRPVDLQELVLYLADQLHNMDLDVWLFGSRKDKTGSTRSDIDLLVSVGTPIDQDTMRAIWHEEPYLDVFRLKNGIAKSIVSESEIGAADDAALIAQLGAVQLLNRGSWCPDSDGFRWQHVLARAEPRRHASTSL